VYIGSINYQYANGSLKSTIVITWFRKLIVWWNNLIDKTRFLIKTNTNSKINWLTNELTKISIIKGKTGWIRAKFDFKP
jgi:hypothetical protein